MSAHCNMPNCRNQAPINAPFCAEHRGGATSLTANEIVHQLRLGPSASKGADDRLMNDAADLIEALQEPSQ